MWRKLYEFGGRLADRGANFAGNPFAIIFVVVLCIAWIAAGYAVDFLTMLLSVLAITLTQMVLNQQRRHEAALHLKIDELVHSLDGARDDIMGAELLTEAEIEELRVHLPEVDPANATPKEHVSF